MGGIVGIQDTVEAGHEFPEEFEALRSQLDRQIGDPGHVATGLGETLDQAEPYRIFDPGEDNRNLGRRARAAWLAGRTSQRGDPRRCAPGRARHPAGGHAGLA